MCTLKGACQHTLFDLGGVEIHEYKRSKQCQRCQRYSTDFKALNAMHVGDVEDGVCSFYATLHTEYCYSSHSCRRCQRCQILLYSVYRASRPSKNWSAEKLLLARSRVCGSDQRDACCMLAGYLLLFKTSERVRITLCIIIQTIQIKKYFELMLRITAYFELNPCINSN